MTRKASKSFGNEGWDDKTGSNFVVVVVVVVVVVLHFNDRVVGFKLAIVASEKQFLRLLTNVPKIFLFRICYKKINK